MKLFITLVAASLLFAAPVMAEESPVSVAGATTVSTAEAAVLFDKGVPFIDVRSDSDFDAGRIPSAIHLNVKSALTEESLLAVVGKDDPVVMYCNGSSCLRSAHASAMAVEWGFTQVNYYRDGYPAWEAAGNPVE